MTKLPQPCQKPGCAEAGIVTLQQGAYCRQHFLEVGYGKLEEYANWLAGHCMEDVDSSVVRRFIADCTRGATDVANTVPDLDNLERARLLDLILRAAEMSRELRRSPRKLMAIPVQLRLDAPGRGWSEVTVTDIVSRHGAKLCCQNPVEVGDRLIITRPGATREARARVAWRRRRPGGGYELGIELLGCTNYWELEWEEAEAVHEPSPVTTTRSS